jgi:probable rRNA maturation factor
MARQMAFEIELIPDFELPAELSTETLVQAVRVTLEHERVQEGNLSILLSDDTRLAALNSAYRGLDEPTDVLAFPAGEEPALPDESTYLGDIAVSVPRAQAQASEAGHSLMEELQLLVIHGTLHLLGHDHGEPDEQERMWAAQRAILENLGLPASLSG